jgi:uncharacterized NAD(P)/FAD-binding protein YdhS
MNARAGEVVARRSPDTLRIAVIGGGFTGAAFIIHAIRASQLAAGNEIAPRLQFDLVERSAEIGRGIAYGTRDPLHRINVPSDRMSLLADDPTHATRCSIQAARMRTVTTTFRANTMAPTLPRP